MRRSVEDISAFVNIPGERTEDILKDTPEQLLDVMADLLRALLYSMNLPESETENVVSKIKGRKVARLFENMKIDIQAERRETEKAHKELEEARGEVEKTRGELDELKRSLEVYKLINEMLRKGCSESEIRKSLMQSFSLTEEQVENDYSNAFKK